MARANRLAGGEHSKAKALGLGLRGPAADIDHVRASAAALAEHMGFALGEVREPVALEDVTLAPPRIAAPASLAGICTNDAHARACHALGKSTRT